MKKKLSVLLVLLLAVAISAYSVGGTYAKYTSTITGTSASARVAKWGFTVGGVAATNEFTFNLFDTILDDDVTTAETHVDTDGSGSEKVIAPGTGGVFAIALANTGEVDAAYTIDFTVSNNSIPLEFKINNGEWGTLDDVSEAVAINKNSDTSLTIYWRWAFEASGDAAAVAARDASDTTLGVTATTNLNDENDETLAPSVSVTAAITVAQVD